jgi:hypothetical protein
MSNNLEIIVKSLTVSLLLPWFEAMPETVRDAVKEYLGWHLLVKARKK